MSEKKYIQIGGSPDKAVQGDYTLNPNAILKEGWQLTASTKQPILLGLIMVILIGMVFSIITSSYLGGMEVVIQDANKQMVLNLVVTVVLWPFIAGIEMMGISHAIGIKTQANMIFSFLKRSAFIALGALIITSLTSLGFYLILPGIYLTVALSLTVPLIVEKRMSPTAAILLSIKATRFQFFKMLHIYLVLFSVLIAALLPGLLGLPAIISAVVFFVVMSYLAPMFYNVKGILYREIFGVKMLMVEKQGDSPADSFFDA